MIYNRLWLQCGFCGGLSLRDPDHGRCVAKPMEIPLAKLIQGKDYGCDGCRLVCEVIPLLKDYYTEPADAEKLFVSAEGWSGTISPLVGNEPWRLRVLDDNHRCIGEFELFKADGKRRPQLARLSNRIDELRLPARFPSTLALYTKETCRTRTSIGRAS